MKKVFGVLLVLTFFGVQYWGYTSSKQVTPETKRPSENFVNEEKLYSLGSYAIKPLPITSKNMILLLTEVTPESANAVIGAISKHNTGYSKDPVYLLIDSPGGSVLDGARIISAIQASKVPVNTVCVTLCASMASMILEYGAERYSSDRAIIMFHPASITVMEQGELDKIVSRYTFLKRYVDKMDHHTAERAGMTYVEFKAKASQEYWLDAEDALNAKLLDGITHVDLEDIGAISAGSNKVRTELELFQM